MNKISFKYFAFLFLFSIQLYTSDKTLISTENPLFDKWFNAVVNKDYELVKKMLVEEPINKIAKNIALKIAIIRDNPLLTEILLSEGADPNVLALINNRIVTPLIEAFQCCKYKLVKLVYIANAKYLVKFDVCSKSKNYKRIIELLVRYGANINHDFEEFLTRQKKINLEIVEIALKLGVDYINFIDENLYPKLNPTIRSLLKSQLAIDTFNDKIFDAYKNHDLENFKNLIVQLCNLIKSKNYLKELFLLLKDNEGNTVLHKAIANSDYDIIDYILKYNTKVIPELLDTPNHQGMTPIDLSVNDVTLLKYFMDLAYYSSKEKNCIIA